MSAEYQHHVRLRRAMLERVPWPSDVEDDDEGDENGGDEQ